MILENGHEGSGAAWENLESFIQNAPVGIHIVDANGIILFANKAELALFGYKEEEYIGRFIKDFYFDPAYIEELDEELMREGKILNRYAKIICKDGSLKEVLINCNIYYENGKFKHTRCFTRDITQIRKAENLLKFLNKGGEELASTHDTNEALDKIIKFLIPGFADWIIINELQADGFGHLLKMGHSNPAKAKLAKKYRENHPIDFNDPKRGSVGYVMRTGEALLVPNISEEMVERGAQDNEHAEILKKLSIKSVMIIPMQAKGRPTGVVSFISCSEQKLFDESDFNFAKDFCNRIALTLENTKLYEEVKRDIEDRIAADEKKNEFISIASHELKTPVTSLKAYTQILQATFIEDENPQAVEMLSKMDKQVDKLTRLIVDLLDVTKIEKGEMVFEKEKFDFNIMVREIAEEMQRTTKTHKIILQLNPCDPIKGDRNRISQVIVNFISNAIKYSPQKDEIVIKTSCENNKVRLSVSDMGIGIPKEEHPNIFKRFYRVSGRNNYTFPGMGLGLFISSEIIKRHDGKIFFESEDGKGSTFSFEINGYS